MICGLLSMLLGGPAAAGPWMDPGDERLRHYVQLLGDAGLVRVPLTTWPLAWADVMRDVDEIDGRLSSPTLDAARRYVINRYHREARTHEIRMHYGYALALNPRQLRRFEDTARESAQLQAGADWAGSTFALRAQGAVVSGPEDDETTRYDGSYAAAILGNWAYSVGMQERWWGPGWDGSLILSNNARPIPAVTVQRHYSDPFDNKWLSWLGPWQFLATLGRLEHDRYVPDALFMGMRLSIRPFAAFELGVSRSAQWGGEGRPESLSTLQDLLLGSDNVGTSGVTAANEPGNQLAGFDLRWQSPLFDLPYAVYGQAIGEDEASGMPYKYIGLAGIETWGTWGDQGESWRLHAEYVDTAVNAFIGRAPAFGMAYSHHIYKDGYTYLDRIIGHALNRDGRMLSSSLLYLDHRHRSWQLSLHYAEPNRDQLNTKEAGVELAHRREWGGEQIGLRAALLRRSGGGQGESDSEGQLEVQWRRDF